MKNAMARRNWLRQPGVLAALTAALLFGAGTPFAKLLLSAINPWLLAGLLYLGSGVGLTLYRWLTKAPAVKLPRREALWFAGAILAGGITAPVLLMFPDAHHQHDHCHEVARLVQCRDVGYHRAPW